MGKLLLTLFAVIMTANLTARAADDVQVLLDADFTVLKDGSEAEPELIDKSALEKLVPSVYKFSSSMKNLYQAGGSLLIKDGGYLEFSSLSSLPSYPKGIVRITAEVKMGDFYGGGLSFSNTTYSTAKTTTKLIYDDEWTTVSFYWNELGRTDRLGIQPLMSASGVFVKAVKVEYSTNFIIPTTAYLPNDANGESFTAIWAKVTGASGYELDVYSYDGENPVYVMQNESVSSVYNNKKVTGLDPTKTYYYVVRVKGSTGNVSDNSNEIEVVRCITEIGAPKALSASNVTESSFTANWEMVPDAVAYNINVYEITKIDQATESIVFGEDFSGVNIGTVSLIEFGGPDLNTFTKVQGWETDLSKCYAAGYYVMYNQPDGGFLITPEIDLSANDGKFECVITAASGSNGKFFETTDELYVELLENDEVIEKSDVKIINSVDFTGYRFALTKGSTQSRLRIAFMPKESYRLYIDEINIYQVLPAGSELKQQIGNYNVKDVTSYDIVIDRPKSDAKYSYGVIAVGQTVVGSGSSAEVGDILSKESNNILVTLSAGIDAIAADVDAPKAWKAGEGVLGVNGSAVTVCDLAGRTIYKNVLPADSYTLNINVRGLVIVVVDGKAYKIVL